MSDIFCEEEQHQLLTAQSLTPRSLRSHRWNNIVEFFFSFQGGYRKLHPILLHTDKTFATNFAGRFDIMCRNIHDVTILANRVDEHVIDFAYILNEAVCGVCTEASY